MLYCYFIETRLSKEIEGNIFLFILLSYICPKIKIWDMTARKSEKWEEQRVKTHITGLDRLLYGGLNLGQYSYFILIKGAADTEKTMFGMQMLYGIAQSLSSKRMDYNESAIPSFISTFNSEEYLNNLSTNAFVSICMRHLQKKNLHNNLNQLNSPVTLTHLLFETEDLICDNYPSKDIIPYVEIANNPDGLIVEGALYYNVRTHALHMRTSEKRDDRRNMVYRRRHDTIHDFCNGKVSLTSQNEGNEGVDIPQRLKDIVGMELIDINILGNDKSLSAFNDPKTKLLGIELKAYSRHKMHEIKKQIDSLQKGRQVFILIVDERTPNFDDDADMIIDLSSEFVDDYLSYYFKITKSNLQETALGYHQYKRREYGIEVFPSVHFYIQQRWYLRKGLLYTHSNVISERFFEYIERKTFQEATEISYSDYLEHKESNKLKRYNDIYQPESLNFVSYDLLNKILIGEPVDSTEQTESIYGNVGSVTGIIGYGNTYKRFLTFGSAFRTALGDEHVLLLLLNKEDNTIRRRMACPARLLKRKHKGSCECMRCYEHIHFMNIPMGAITPEEFLYSFDRQLRNKYDNGKTLKRVIIDDLQILDYCYPKLSKDPLFLPALIYICREYGVMLYLLCDKNCKLRDPLRSLADNIICTEKTDNGKPRIYIERYAGYNITPSKMYCGEVADIEKLFVCHDRYDENGNRIRKAENYLIDSTDIKDRKLSDMTEYWKHII